MRVEVAGRGCDDGLSYFLYFVGLGERHDGVFMVESAGLPGLTWLGPVTASTLGRDMIFLG